MVIGFIDGEIIDEDKFIAGAAHLDDDTMTVLIDKELPADCTLGASILRLATEFDKFYTMAVQSQSAPKTTGK